MEMVAFSASRRGQTNVQGRPGALNMGRLIVKDVVVVVVVVRSKQHSAWLDAQNRTILSLCSTLCPLYSTESARSSMKTQRKI